MTEILTDENTTNSSDEDSCWLFCEQTGRWFCPPPPFFYSSSVYFVSCLKTVIFFIFFC
jgi:hypothetical protein